MCVCVFYVLCLHPEGVTRAIYACACDDVGAVKFINVTRTHLSVCVGEILLYVRGASRASYRCEREREYRQIFFLSPFFFRLMESSRSVVY